MKWSLKVGRILGIDVYIHATFLILLVFVGMAYWQVGQSLQAAIVGILFFLALFLCVLLHEFGHALVARRYGIATRDITLLPIGGLARLERMPEKPAQELRVALAGPAVNVVIAGVLAACLTATGDWQPVSALGVAQGGMLERLFLINVFLFVFNMLPAFPMDGGRVLRALLAMRMDFAEATRVAAAIGQGMALFFGMVGLFSNPMLVFIAFFVWIGAAHEARSVEARSVLHGHRVREAMLTDFRTLSRGDTLADAVRLLLSGSQHDFPVIENGRPVGMLLRTDLFQALQERGDAAAVVDIMRTPCTQAEDTEDLEGILPRVQEQQCSTVPVMRDGALVGLLTTENIGEFVMIRTALNHRRTNPAFAG